MNKNNIKVIALVAMDEARVIGVDNGLPWHLPEDMKNFSRLTKGHTVLMGRKTFDSLPTRFKPLPERKNVVISRTVKSLEKMPDVLLKDDPCEFIQSVLSGDETIPSEKLWVIGGEQIYRATQSLWSEIYLTLVNDKHKGDAFFPEFEQDFELKDKQLHEGFSFLQYQRKT